MSLLSKLKDKAVSTVQDERVMKKWVDTGFDSTIDRARDMLPQGDKPTEIAARNVGSVGLDKIAEHKDELVGLGRDGLRATLILLASGNSDDAAKQAVLLSVRERASWDEVGEAITSAADAGDEAKRKSDAREAAILGALADIGIAVAKNVLPLILGA